jgi:hypothetical protein
MTTETVQQTTGVTVAHLNKEELAALREALRVASVQLDADKLAIVSLRIGGVNSPTTKSAIVVSVTKNLGTHEVRANY